MNAIRNPAAKFLLIPLAVAAIYLGETYLRSQPAAGPPVNWATPFPAQPQSQPTEVEFTVASGIVTSGGLMLLNDSTDYKAPTCRTVVVDLKRITTAGSEPRLLIGKTIHVKGHTSTYKGKPQVTADSIAVK